MTNRFISIHWRISAASCSPSFGSKRYAFVIISFFLVFQKKSFPFFCTLLPLIQIRLFPLIGYCRVNTINSSLDLFSHSIWSSRTANSIVQYDFGRFIYVDVHLCACLQKFCIPLGSNGGIARNGPTIITSWQQFLGTTSTQNNDASSSAWQLYAT